MIRVRESDFFPPAPQHDALAELLAEVVALKADKRRLEDAVLELLDRVERLEERLR